MFSNPQRRRHVVDISTFTGWTWDNIERAYWKRYAEALEIRPGTVRAYIEKNLIGKDFPPTNLWHERNRDLVWYVTPEAPPESWEPPLR